MVTTKHGAEDARLDGCEPSPWVLSLLGKLQPGQLGEQRATDMHDEVQWGGGGKGAEGVREQGWCQSFEGTDRTGAGVLGLCPDALLKT